MDGHTIKIGFFAPLTGFAAADGTSAKHAVEIGVNAINEKGGINGKNIELVVYDAQGRRVRTLRSGMHQAGEYNVRWDGRTDEGLRSAVGLYFLRLLAEGMVTASRKIVLVR